MHKYKKALTPEAKPHRLFPNFDLRPDAIQDYLATNILSYVL